MLMYTKVMGQDYDPSFTIGRGWKFTFGTENTNYSFLLATFLFKRVMLEKLNWQTK